MPQVTKQSYDEVRIPLTAMSFTPDVPATQLGANEYNAGLNVEADVRGIRSVAGEQEILSHIPGTPNYITGGFRQDGYFWFVAATDEGKWWANRGDHIGNPTGNGGVWIDITPGGTTFTGYAQNTNITNAWNGTVPFFNDALNPPMFWPDNESTVLVTTGVSGDGTSATATFASPGNVPYSIGDFILVEGVTPATYNGYHTVSAVTSTSVSWLSTEVITATVQGTISGPIPQMISYSNQFPGAIRNIVPVVGNVTEQTLTLDNTFQSTGSTIGVIGGVNTLTIGTLTAGTPQPGQYLYGAGIPAGTYIVGNISGTGNGSTWSVNQPITIASENIDGSLYSVATPFNAGDKINISGVGTFFDGNFKVVSSTYLQIIYVATPGATYPGPAGTGTVAPQYTWNSNPNYRSVTAGWMRMYTTPNVGCILVAGNLTATLTNGTQQVFPATVQWSQAFGLNSAPLTWTPTIVNVANQLEVPLRGPSLDAFPAAGLLFVCSYWDVVAFSPINYSTTSAPLLGVRLFNQGRGLLSANCWATADNLVYGVDARDIWVFDGQNFKGIGNQRVKNYFFDQLDPLFVDRVFMQTNTQKNQVEIYYPTTAATAGVPNMMISYRYDIDCWNAPREVYNATFATESPVWVGNTNTYPNVVPITLTGTGSGCEFNVTQFGTQYTVSPVGGTQGSGYAVGDTLKITGDLVGGTTPANDIIITVDSIGPSGAPTGVDFTTAMGNASGYNIANFGSRCVVYARGVVNTKPVQKDQGFSNLDSNPIISTFTRDNIKMLPNYSGKLMVHRILPEIVNLDGKGIPLDPTTAPTQEIGGVAITIEAANSVGQTPQAITTVAVPTNTDNPWAQIDQNAFRVNSLTLSNESNLNTWLCSATTWQYTEVEDDR